MNTRIFHLTIIVAINSRYSIYLSEQIVAPTSVLSFKRSWVALYVKLRAKYFELQCKGNKILRDRLTILMLPDQIQPDFKSLPPPNTTWTSL